jgi:hypothetical protein
LKLYALTLATAFLLLAGLVAEPAHGQVGPLRRARQARLVGVAQKENLNAPRRVNPAPNANGGAPKGQPNLRGMAGLPPKWVENMRTMSPEEQERFMQNNETFKNLPPERQAQIRQNLQKWNNLTPEQQTALRQREAVLEQMTPEQRRYFNQTVLPKWQAMPQERRQAINRHLAMLGKMGPETQQSALNDPRFLQGLSPDEQSMLRDLNSLRNPTTP